LQDGMDCLDGAIAQIDSSQDDCVAIVPEDITAK